MLISVTVTYYGHLGTTTVHHKSTFKLDHETISFTRKGGKLRCFGELGGNAEAVRSPDDPVAHLCGPSRH